MSDVDTAKVLSNEHRWEVIKSIRKGPKDVKEIAADIGLKPTAVRHHLQQLTRSGLVEGHTTLVKVGRPKVIYKATNRSVHVNYPIRRYDLLAELLIEGVLQCCPTTALQQVGRKVGLNTMNELKKKHDVREWTPQLFKKHFLEGALSQYGTEPSLTKIGGREVVYSEKNCPFQELAVKYPETICDMLDTAFHEGLAEAMGPDVKAKKLKCMGHGDPYCEYSMMWGNGVNSRRTEGSV